MELSAGRADVTIGMLDGPVATDVAALASRSIRVLNGSAQGFAHDDASEDHGTFVAGILSARRGEQAPAICPDCSLLVRPILLAPPVGDPDPAPRATLHELATAIREVVHAGVHVVNLSVATRGHDARSEREVTDALDEAMKRQTLVVAAAGNHPIAGTSVLTAHPWVIPVAAYNLVGRPSALTNLAPSAARRGVGAPGEAIVSVTRNGGYVKRSGTSLAAAFVSGVAALLWSLAPSASAEAVRFSVTHSSRRSHSVIPPLLNSWAAWHLLNRQL